MLMLCLYICRPPCILSAFYVRPLYLRGWQSEKSLESKRMDGRPLYAIHIRHRLQVEEAAYTVKKVIAFPVPSRDVIYQTLPGRE